MNDLEQRLYALGDVLDLGPVDRDGDTGLVDAVLGRIDATDRKRRRDRVLLRAAVILLVIAAALIAALPGPRRAVAGWLGFDSVRIERVTDLDVGDVPGLAQLPGPGDSSIVTVGGREVLVSAIDGSLSDPLLSKTVGAGTAVSEVAVGDARGLWISGEPHEIAYETNDGGVVVDRFAGNTLLWQVGDVLYRVEGFDNVADAIAFASGTG